MTKNDYLLKSKRLLTVAKREAKKASKDSMLLRNACGKAWLSAVEAGKAQFIKKGVKEEKLPKSNRGLFYFMRKYFNKNMRKNFNYFYSFFHIRGYYDEEKIDLNEFKESIEYLEEFIQGVEK